MRPTAWPNIAFLVILLLMGPVATAADPDGWVELTGSGDFSAWRKPTGAWLVAGSVRCNPNNSKRLLPGKGTGAIVNGKDGRTNNLLSKESFGDFEAHIEFLIPKGSNSGVKFQGLYEIQIEDSAGVNHPTASDCGGIYPRAEQEPTYHLIDKGVPPRINAAKPAGEWQTLEVKFRAPRFDAAGKKSANARFVRVVLNGRVIHEDVEQKTPTGHVWREKEVPTGPLLLQADHGPVAFRNVRVRPLAGR